MLNASFHPKFMAKTINHKHIKSNAAFTQVNYKTKLQVLDFKGNKLCKHNLKNWIKKLLRDKLTPNVAFLKQIFDRTQCANSQNAAALTSQLLRVDRGQTIRVGLGPVASVRPFDLPLICASIHIKFHATNPAKLRKSTTKKIMFFYLCQCLASR